MDGPPCQLPIAAPPALRSHAGLCIAAQRTSQRPPHGHRQIRSRRSVSACHSIGGCSFCLIDIPFRTDGDLSGQGLQADPSGPLPSNGRAWARRSVPHQAPARRVHGTPPIAASTIFVTDGIWHRQIEPRSTWRTTHRHDTSCDKRRPHLSPQLQPDMAQGTVMTDSIYKYQYGCPYTEVMADGGKKLSTLFSTVEKIRSVAPLCPTC